MKKIIILILALAFANSCNFPQSISLEDRINSTFYFERVIVIDDIALKENSANSNSNSDGDIGLLDEEIKGSILVDKNKITIIDIESEVLIPFMNKFKTATIQSVLSKTKKDSNGNEKTEYRYKTDIGDIEIDYIKNLLKITSVRYVFSDGSATFYLLDSSENKKDSLNTNSSQQLPLPLSEVSNGWSRVYIENVGSIDMPETMEIQSENYRKIVEKLNEFKVGESDLIFQPKGINKKENQALNRYARVIFNTQKGEKGEFPKNNEQIKTCSSVELSELNNSYHNGLLKSFQGTGMIILDWIPLKVVKINGMYCLTYSYTRQLNDKPIVQVSCYVFPNYDRAHMLTLSYRVSEKNYWEDAMIKILDSFRISQIIL